MIQSQPIPARGTVLPAPTGQGRGNPKGSGAGAFQLFHLNPQPHERDRHTNKVMDHIWDIGDSPGSPQSCSDCGSQDRSLTASRRARFPSVPFNAWSLQETKSWSDLVLQTGKSPAKAGHSSHISSLLPSSSCTGPPITLKEGLWHGCHPDIRCKLHGGALTSTASMALLL